LVKNFNGGQKSKFWSTILIVIKEFNFGKTLIFSKIEISKNLKI